MLRATFFYVVGIAQLVSASDCGSEGPGFESLYPPLSIFGLSPSGKAQGFDPCITLVRIQLAQLDIRYPIYNSYIRAHSSVGRALDF